MTEKELIVKLLVVVGMLRMFTGLAMYFGSKLFKEDCKNHIEEAVSGVFALLAALLVITISAMYGAK